MKIAILAPTHKSFIGKFLSNYSQDDFPEGYYGAPFLGILIEEYLKLGHEVTAITTSSSETIDIENKVFKNGSFKWVVVPARKHSIRNNGVYRGRILDFFKKERILMRDAVIAESPDIIHAHWSYEFSGALKGLNIPHLITVHDNAFLVLRYMTNFYRFGRLLMSEWVLKGTHYASTVSPYMEGYVKRRCKEFRIIPNPVKVPYNLSDVTARIDDKIAGFEVGGLIIMVMNGWNKLKNGENGLLAFKMIHDKYPEIKLHLYGAGSEIEGLANKCAAKNNIGNIEFCGPVSHSELMEGMKEAVFMLHPAYEESFGVVLIEAMAQGIPVIGGEHSGAVPWVIQQKDLLVDISKPVDIAAAVLGIVRNKQQYKKIALACYSNTVHRFSEKEIAKQYIDYYQDIISKERCL